MQTNEMLTLTYTINKLEAVMKIRKLPISKIEDPTKFLQFVKCYILKDAYPNF